jgi:hypothetical protein
MRNILFVVILKVSQTLPRQARVAIRHGGQQVAHRLGPIPTCSDGTLSYSQSFERVELILLCVRFPVESPIFRSATKRVRYALSEKRNSRTKGAEMEWRDRSNSETQKTAERVITQMGERPAEPLQREWRGVGMAGAS